MATPPKVSSHGTPEKSPIQQATFEENLVEQIMAYDDPTDWDTGFNEVTIPRNFRPIREHDRRRVTKSGQEAEQEHARIEAIEKTEESATRFQQSSPELKREVLLTLLASLTPNDTAETILHKIYQHYADPSLVDETLDFIIENSSGEIRENALRAKAKLNENFPKEISAGRNIKTHVQIAEKEGLGPPPQMRDLYREVTGNPTDPFQLFEKLTQRYSFMELRKVIRFLLHSIGTDLKSKGPSMAAGELYKLLNDVRTLQAILWVFLFFRSRMTLLHLNFHRRNKAFPYQLSFELLSKTFMKLLQERYLPADRLSLFAQNLGVMEKEDIIIVFMQIRDAVRQVAPRLFKSEKQKEELLGALISFLEKMEE